MVNNGSVSGQLYSYAPRDKEFGVFFSQETSHVKEESSIEDTGTVTFARFESHETI